MSRKSLRRSEGAGGSTDARSRKRLRGSKGDLADAITLRLTDALPPDLILACVSYVPTSADRFALQMSCRALRWASNSRDMMKVVDLVGDLDTGERSVLVPYLNDDTSRNAISKLKGFALMGNHDAIYLLGIMAIYCYDEATSGVLILRTGAKLGCPRCMHNLSMMGELDSKAGHAENRTEYLQAASDAGYVPGTMDLKKEKTNEEIMKACGLEGGPRALVAHLKINYRFPAILLRGLWGATEAMTSKRKKRQCQNPSCGRWAYKNKSSVRTWLRERPEPSPQTIPQLFRDFAIEIGTRQGIPNVSSQEGLPRRMQAVDLSGCGRCWRASYCSRACQSIDWSDHRGKCRRRAAAAANNHGP